MWRWIVPIVLVAAVLMVLGLGYRRRGPPVPSLFRPRREPPGDTVYRLDPDVAYRPSPPGWGLFADLLWALVILALGWLLAAILFT